MSLMINFICFFIRTHTVHGGGKVLSFEKSLMTLSYILPRKIEISFDALKIFHRKATTQHCLNYFHH